MPTRYCHVEQPGFYAIADLPGEYVSSCLETFSLFPSKEPAEVLRCWCRLHETINSPGQCSFGIATMTSTLPMGWEHVHSAVGRHTKSEGYLNLNPSECRFMYYQAFARCFQNLGGRRTPGTLAGTYRRPPAMLDSGRMPVLWTHFSPRVCIGLPLAVCSCAFCCDLPYI